MALLEIRDLCVNYGPIQAVRGVNMDVEEGSIVALLGANGARQDHDAQDDKRRYKARLRQRQIWRQRDRGPKGKPRSPAGDQHVARGKTYLQRIERRGEPARRRLLHTQQGRDGEEHEARAPALPEAGRAAPAACRHLVRRRAQMLAISRALMASPKLLLLDEPSLGLAPLIIRDIFHALQEIRAEGTTILIVEQNALATLKIADRAYVLELGRISMEGRADVLIHDERLIEAYLGNKKS